MGIPSNDVAAHPPHPANLTPALPAPPPAALPPAPPPTTSHAVIDPALLTTANLGRGRQRTLAQPMGRNWAHNREDALADAAASKSLKTQRQEIDDKKKRTCEVLIWFEVGA